jgi:hypothetical protein
MSSLATVASSIETETDFEDEVAIDLNRTDIKDIREKISESYGKLQRLQNDLIEYLRNLGIDQNSFGENIQTGKIIQKG